MAVSRGDERGFVCRCRWCVLLEIVVGRNLIGARVGVFHPRGSGGEVQESDKCARPHYIGPIKSDSHTTHVCLCMWTYAHVQTAQTPNNYVVLF